MLYIENYFNEQLEGTAKHIISALVKGQTTFSPGSYSSEEDWSVPQSLEDIIDSFDVIFAPPNVFRDIVGKGHHKLEDSTMNWFIKELLKKTWIILNEYNLEEQLAPQGFLSYLDVYQERINKLLFQL